jgi:hypothetical protein
VGRGRLASFALQRVKASLPLQICMAVAFLCYGALVFLVVSGEVELPSAAIVVLLSLASWFFLFWWFPVLERTQLALKDDPGREWIPRALEIFATLCVAVVHILMFVMIVLRAQEQGP